MKIDKEKQCPCGSGESYSECCKPLHEGKPARNAAAVMRARYSAYALQAIPYLETSTHPDKREEVDSDASSQWAKSAEWLGLEILQSQAVEPDVELVEFTAHYTSEGERLIHHEVARFEKQDEHWYFYEGELVAPEPYRREEPRIGRNAPCPCGSGKKFKKCCHNKPIQERS